MNSSVVAKMDKAAADNRERQSMHSEKCKFMAFDQTGSWAEKKTASTRKPLSYQPGSPCVTSDKNKEVFEVLWNIESWPGIEWQIRRKKSAACGHDGSEDLKISADWSHPSPELPACNFCSLDKTPLSWHLPSPPHTTSLAHSTAPLETGQGQRAEKSCLFHTTGCWNPAPLQRLGLSSWSLQVLSSPSVE